MTVNLLHSGSKHHHWLNVALLSIALLLVSNAQAGGKNSGGGFIDFNLYPHLTDVDTDSAFTLNIASKLPNRFSYFSLTNFYDSPGGSFFDDSVNYYTEQNIRWQIADDSPLDLTLQMNLRSGTDNDRHRLGVRWRLNNTKAFTSFFKSINLSWSINLHAIQFDHEDSYVWQVEHVFRMTFPQLSKKLYVAGFIDHTFNQNLAPGMPDRPIIGEVQAGYEIASNFFLITEYRLNQYRRSDVNNLALGLEYKIVW